MPNQFGNVIPHGPDHQLVVVFYLLTEISHLRIGLRVVTLGWVSCWVKWLLEDEIDVISELVIDLCLQEFINSVRRVVSTITDDF